MGFWDFLSPKPNKADQAAQCFNDYQRWFTSLDPTKEELDITITVRIRAFGSESQKQAEWDRCWRSKFPNWCPVAAGCNVSSEIPELWMDLRMSKGGLILPMGVLAHEFCHSIHNTDRKVADPDTLVKDIY